MQGVPSPPLSVALIDKEAVVAHYVSSYRVYTGLLHLFSQLVHHVHGLWQRLRLVRGVGWRGGNSLRPLVGITARTQRRIAHAEENQVAIQHAVAIEFAAGYHVRRPGQRLHREQGKGRSRGGELDVRGRGKQAPLIQPIELLSIQRGHADAKLRMTQRRLGENGVDAITNQLFRRSGRRRLSGTGLRRGLCKQAGGRNKKHRQYERRNSQKEFHGGSLAGGKQIA